MIKVLEKIKLHKKVVILSLLFIAVVIYCLANVFYKSKSEQVNFTNSNGVDINKITEAIKKVESEYPPRIGKTPTDKEIYSSLYIKHIRLALNGYLDGTNTGVEVDAIGSTNNDMRCGLNNFSKDYYQSKFVILDASDNDYGGVQAVIVFVDKPDTGFWIWVYRLGGDGEYVLRALCEKPPLEKDKEIFKTYIDDVIKNTKYLL